MQSIVAYLLVTVVASQARWINPGYGMGGFTGYYPVAPAAPVAYHGVPAAVPAVVPAYGYPSFTSTQYHAQDELGQARFGYAHPGQAASNYRDGLGNQIGSYAYFNPEGKEVRVSYTADHRGFRVLSNDLPVAPVANLVAPVQVPETIEVAQAKAAHLAAHAEAKAAHAAAKAALPVTPVAPAAPTTTA
ncbi:cuticle protein 7-like [Daphnia pulex]|uniref:cuticle protein 7-like n=1 Tax=Daphnia pulex TaxID=6669 RepID=UPI001EE08B40|nr:cuticle protein 7-like [Daphnia pulex]